MENDFRNCFNGPSVLAAAAAAEAAASFSMAPLPLSLSRRFTPEMSYLWRLTGLVFMSACVRLSEERSLEEAIRFQGSKEPFDQDFSLLLSLTLCLIRPPF